MAALKGIATPADRMTEAPLNQRIEIGLFTADPRGKTSDTSHVILMERHPIRSGRQVLKFLTDRKPAFAGIDPYDFYMNWTAGDNVVVVR